MTPRRFRFLLTLPLLVGAAACDEAAEPAPTERAADEPATPAATPAAAADIADIGAADVVAPEDWRAWMDAEVGTLQASDRAAFDALMSLEPMPTRADTLRFRGDLVRDPAAAAVLLHRLTTGHEDAAVRAAIVEALPRTGADVGSAIAELLALESDAGVREVMVATLWRAPGDAGLAGLRRGMNDAEPAVRAAAVQAAARHARGSELGAELVAALAHADAATRMQAIRAVGALKVDAAKAGLVGLLAEDDAKVRASSVRALGRIDASWAAAQPAVQALSGDEDPGVSRAVADLVP
jgi:hypothetical protein